MYIAIQPERSQDCCTTIVVYHLNASWLRLGTCLHKLGIDLEKRRSKRMKKEGEQQKEDRIDIQDNIDHYKDTRALQIAHTIAGS